jgi:hypothetical protein
MFVTLAIALCIVFPLTLTSRWTGPILLGVPTGTTTAEADRMDRMDRMDKAGTNLAAAQHWRDLPRHKDEDQVQLDVNRAFIYYPNRQSPAVSPILHPLAWDACSLPGS